jgi:hypothetical protein
VDIFITIKILLSSVTVWTRRSFAGFRSRKSICRLNGVGTHINLNRADGTRCGVRRGSLGRRSPKAKGWMWERGYWIHSFCQQSVIEARPHPPLSLRGEVEHARSPSSRHPGDEIAHRNQSSSILAFFSLFLICQSRNGQKFASDESAGDPLPRR